MNHIRRKRTKTRRLLLGFLFLIGSPSALTLQIGLPMVVIGQLINLLTYGILTKRDSLVTTGPYGWCRNPFYVGTFLTDFGFCVMCNPTKIMTLAIIIGYALLQGSNHFFQIRREEKLLRSIHGEAYDQYCSNVRWRLLPSLISAIKNKGFSFNWSAKLALRNKVYSRVLSAGFWALAFWAISIATSGQSYVLAFDMDFRPVLKNTTFLVVTAIVTTIYIIFRILESPFRKGKKQSQTT